MSEQSENRTSNEDHDPTLGRESDSPLPVLAALMEIDPHAMVMWHAESKELLILIQHPLVHPVRIRITEILELKDQESRMLLDSHAKYRRPSPDPNSQQAGMPENSVDQLPLREILVPNSSNNLRNPSRLSPNVPNSFGMLSKEASQLDEVQKNRPSPNIPKVLLLDVPRIQRGRMGKNRNLRLRSKNL